MTDYVYEHFENFMEYLENTYVGFSSYEGMMSRDIMYGIVRYAYEKFGHSKNAAMYFVWEIISDTGITYKEVAKYLPRFSE